MKRSLFLLLYLLTGAVFMHIFAIFAMLVITLAPSIAIAQHTSTLQPRLSDEALQAIINTLAAQREASTNQTVQLSARIADLEKALRDALAEAKKCVSEKPQDSKK